MTNRAVFLELAKLTQNAQLRKVYLWNYKRFMRRENEKAAAVTATR